MEDLSFLENKKFTKDKCQLKSDCNSSCGSDTKLKYNICYYDKEEQSHVHFTTTQEANEYQRKLDIRQGDKIFYGGMMIVYLVIGVALIISFVIIPNIKKK